MIQKKINHKSGFIAIIYVILITAVLIGITFTLSTSSILARFNVLNSEFKNISSHLAEGCLDVAMIKLINEPSYNPTNDVVTIGTNYCTIVSVTTFGSQKIIATQAIYPTSGNQKSYSNFQITITQNPGNIVIDDWREVAHF